jgi:phage-related minor tail protein
MAESLQANQDQWTEWMEGLEMTFSDFQEALMDTFDTMTNGFGDAMGRVLVDGESFKDSMKMLWNDIARNFISAIASMIAQAILLWVLQTVLGKKAATSLVSTKAGEAWASGISSVMASVPFPANIIMAPIVAGAAFTMAMAGATMFAKGGIVMGPTLGILGEAGPEAVIPLNRMDMIGRTQTINLYMDGRLVTASVLHNMPDEVRLNLGSTI